MKQRLNYASVTATLALLLAVGGTAAAGAQGLITGRSVKDDSLTGADIQNDSLTGADIREGSLGSNLLSLAARGNLRGATGPAGPKGDTGPQGPAGAGVTVATVSGDDVTDYQDLSTLATVSLSHPADYVVFASVTAHNTGTSDDDLSCGLFIGGQAVGGGDVSVAQGATTTGSTVGAISLSAPAEVTLACRGNGVTTFDLSNVRMRVHDLG